MFFLTAVQNDVPVLLIFEALHQIVNTLLMYFREKLTDQVIRENFALIYQLVDELIVGSFPHTMEPNQLTDMISTPSMTGSCCLSFLFFLRQERMLNEPRARQVALLIILPVVSR